MRRHLFHIVDPSPWPILVAIGFFLFTSGLAFFMHIIFFSGFVLAGGFVILSLATLHWFNDIINESTFLGYHTHVVRNNLKLGFLLFIISEIMLFFGFFWAFFHSASSPSIEFMAIWPPEGIDVINIFDYPLLNTFILLISGFAVTWVHRGIALGSFKEAIDGFIVTIMLGLIFIFLQLFEYNSACFNIMDGAYSSIFYVLTGLHGLHVVVGVIFLSVCLFRLLQNHFSSSRYLGFVFAVWYWHFVDMVWILLFTTIYCWGSW